MALASKFLILCSLGLGSVVALLFTIWYTPIIIELIKGGKK